MGFAQKLLFWLSLWISVYLVNLLIPKPKLNPTIQLCLLVVGIILISYGLALNIIAGKSLKKFGHKQPQDGFSRPDRLVKEGIFSCMRHPAIFGNIFIAIGLAFTTQNAIVILFSGWLSAAGLYFIMNIEERETLAYFKDEYCQFMKMRPPFSFSLKCLIEGIRALRR
ncbi:methyltransferase family protein [Hippea sp. KM1]|uniref:methyltransferase family protein n=1 Tax=Hippea sp. KM1 TaxID=944481 RepID=UPI00046C8FA4|nr:methyltransferase [Hippea sp. KM1]